MQVFYPKYYNRFRCIAGACPDSCCKEWAVDVDREAAAFYRALPGDLGDCLRQVLQDTEDGTVMTIRDGRCPMWRQDGLCRIQAELGHEALCKTCREFPRLRHDYGDFVELGLELSCPEAARLILSADGRMTSAQQAGGEEPDYDRELMAILKQSRSEVLALLDYERYSVPEALAILLLHSHSTQEWIDGGEPVRMDPHGCLEDARRYAGAGDMEGVFAFFGSLEILTEEWEKRLEAGPKTIQWSPELRAMAKYMVRRYWLQAVSDYDLVCRGKLVVTACLVVGAMGDDVVQTAQLFSKEIENDPDNIEAILDGAYTAPALTDVNLLSLLLGKV